MNEQITTAAELDSLPIRTILADNGGHPVWRDRVRGWRAANGTEDIDPDLVIRDGAPLTVLYRPDAPSLGADDQAGGPLEGAPKPTAEAVADALIQYETGGICHYGQTCGLCDCGKADETPEQTQTRDAMELDRARAVLALIPEQRCAPSKAELSAVLIGCLSRDDYLSDTVRAVTKLYADQPTVAQIRARTWREAADRSREEGVMWLADDMDEVADDIESGAEHG